MPSFTFICPKCNEKVSLWLTSSDWEYTFKCSNCPKVRLKRLFQTAPTMSVNETIDNGNYPKEIEQPADIYEMLEEREEQAREDQEKNDL
jgi:protein-arginine kinase activator protein McsA